MMDKKKSEPLLIQTLKGLSVTILDKYCTQGVDAKEDMDKLMDMYTKLINYWGIDEVQYNRIAKLEDKVLIKQTLKGLILTVIDKSCVLGEGAKGDINKIRDIYIDLVNYWCLNDDIDANGNSLIDIFENVVKTIEIE